MGATKSITFRFIGKTNTSDERARTAALAFISRGIRDMTEFYHPSLKLTSAFSLPEYITISFDASEDAATIEALVKSYLETSIKRGSLEPTISRDCRLKVEHGK